MSRNYSYLPFRYLRPGIWTAIRNVHFDSLADARRYAREYAAKNNLPAWSFYILRYHPFRGCEDKEYTI